jgi:integrase
MARKPQVRYFASRGGYYCQLAGRQHRLATGPDDGPGGPTFLAAVEAYKQLLELGAVSTSKDANTLRAVLETYLVRNKDRLSPTTFNHRLYGIRPFTDILGDTAVRDLTHLMVEDFLAKMRTDGREHSTYGKGRRVVRWGDAAVGNFYESVNAGLNWAVRTRLITFNPLNGLRPPPPRSRSRDCVVTPAQHAIILAAAKAEGFKRVIVALENTGCRPSELCAATAAAWDDSAGCLTYYADRTRQAGEHRHKTARKKDRAIFFTGEALDMMRQLVAQYPIGPLFRTGKGKGYTVPVIVSQFYKLRQRIGLPKLSAYSYRHTLATRWLVAGKSVDILAELLGNTPNVIRKHYSHLLSDRAGLRSQLEAFRSPPAADK